MLLLEDGFVTAEARRAIDWDMLFWKIDNEFAKFDTVDDKSVEPDDEDGFVDPVGLETVIAGVVSFGVEEDTERLLIAAVRSKSIGEDGLE